MAIYSRFNSPIIMTRKITSCKEVAELENRPTDDHDIQRLGYGMYVAARLAEGSDEKELLYDVALLKADGGIEEIDAALEKIPEGVPDGKLYFNAKRESKS